MSGQPLRSWEGGLRRGRVAAYDSAEGLGTVEATAGWRLPFHCTQIADGSREIPVGVAVVFRVLPGRAGRWEAGEVTRIDG